MSTTTTAPTTVQSGDYYGFTANELDDELTEYKAAIKKHTQMRGSAAGGTIQFAGLNGKQITYKMDDAEAFFAKWRANIANGKAQLAGSCMDYTDRSVARFK